MKFKYFLFPPLWSFLFLFLCLVCGKTIAQKQGQSAIDSLNKLLLNYKSKCDKPCINDSVKVKLLNQIAWEIRSIDPDSSILYSNQALDISRKINWLPGIGKSYHQLGLFYYFEGDFSLSLSFSEKAIRVWDEIINSIQRDHKNLYPLSLALEKKSETLNSIGTVYANMGDFSKALDFLLQGLRIVEKAGNKKSIGIFLGNIGLVYHENHEYAKALGFFEKSLKMAEENHNQNGVALALGNIARVYEAQDDLTQDDLTKALSYYLKELEIAKNIADERLIALTLGNIGNIYLTNEDFKKALDYYFQALKMQYVLKNKQEIARNLANIGTTYIDMKKYKDAEKYLLQAFEIDTSIGSIKDVRFRCELLVELYEKMSDFKKALNYHKLLTDANDSLFNEEKTQEITRYQMNYEFDKKQDSIKAAEDKKDAIAQQEIAKQKVIRNSVMGGTGAVAIIGFLGFVNFRNRRRREKAELSQQVSVTEMKALRSQMNPHFIFNALQSIQTFLLSHQSEEANIYLLKFSKLMRSVLQNSQHSEVPLKDDIQALELYMQLESIRLSRPFTYKFHIDESVDIENDTIPPLILQPFVENAIWHGLQHKPESGHINIYLSKKDNTLHAIVEDNGIGRDMSKKVLQPMLIKKESLGMKLTEERLKILNEVKKTKAVFTVIDLFTKNNHSAGTKVELLLPLSS